MVRKQAVVRPETFLRTRAVNDEVLQPVHHDTGDLLHDARAASLRQAQGAPCIEPAAKSHRWYAATMETTCQCGLKEFEESPVAKKSRRPGAVFFCREEREFGANGVASKIVFPPEISVTPAPVHDGMIVSPASVFQPVHPGTGALLHVERVIYSSRRPILAQGHFGSDTTLSQ